ncbi:putative calcium-binding protein CML35 [Vitis vinifera]|uniref:Putative calcium-binding protein CML35 n=1 Tax=Vitis vinifera TaxID=29760 RepID=A0A438I650_VITVI|nr:putative calcium-binding protein CML35 [Vitis vinifera]
MKLIYKINPKQLFRSKKSRSVTRTDPSSFSSGTSSSTSSDSSTNLKTGTGACGGGMGTPTSVLPMHSYEISGDWSDFSSDIQTELVHAFKMIDRDGDGKITKRELEALLSRVGVEPPSEEEIMMMLSEVDRDGDGCISLEEFGAISSAFGPACDTELRDAFCFFDTDRDGKITAEELNQVFAAIGDDRCTLEDCQRMIAGVDKNGDGFVCFEDFSRMMEQQQT